jgi:hypothetical protein
MEIKFIKINSITSVMVNVDIVFKKCVILVLSGSDAVDPTGSLLKRFWGCDIFSIPTVMA